MKYHFEDSDGDELSYSVRSSDVNVATVRLGSEPTKYIYITPKGRGTTTITVTADDGKNGIVSDTFEVSVTQDPTLNYIILSNSFWIKGPDRDLRYSSNASGNVRAGDKVPDIFLNDREPDFKDNVNILLSNSNLSVTSITRTSMNGLFSINISGTSQDGDRVELNLNQFQDKNGVVLSGKLVMTYQSGSWVRTIE